MIEFKRISALLLAAVISAGTIASCGEQQESAPAAATAAQKEEEVTAAKETEAAVTVIPDALPDGLDFGGREIRIGFRDTGTQKRAIVEEAVGEVVDDAVYAANMRVSERLNVKLVPVIYNEEGMGPVNKSVHAGDDDFEFVEGHDISIANLSLTGIFLDVYKLQYLDFDKPWWPSYSVESLTVNKHMVLLSGYLSYCNLDATRCFWMNKKLLGDYGKELPYNTVRDGVWTLDLLTEYMKDVYQDINGNTERDEEDLYGWAAEATVYAYQESFDVEPYKEDENGMLYVDGNNEKLLTLVNKTRDALYNTEGGIVLSEVGAGDKFKAGTSMFMYASLGSVTSMRDSDVEYGFLPIPKLDEMQENYISGSTDRPFAVPVTVQDTDCVGAVIEAMASEGYRTVRPAFFDIALKNKYSYDTDSEEMLDIIGDTIILDFAYMYSNYTGYAWSVMTLLEKKSNGDFASYAAKQEKKENKRVDKINQFFQSLDD